MRHLIWLLAVLGPAPVFAQSTIVGVVTDTVGRPLQHAQVYFPSPGFPSTGKWDTTDRDGVFEISVHPDLDSLVVELIGYKVKTVFAQGGDTIRIRLVPTVIELGPPGHNVTPVEGSTPPREVPQPSVGALNAAGRITDFGLDLFREVVDRATGPNVVFSPLGAALTVALLQEGARGPTQAEALSALGYELEDSSRLTRDLADLIPTLTGSDVTFRTGSSMWAKEGNELNADFLQVAVNSHEATARAIDFGDPGQVAQINKWAAEKTAGRISEVIDPFNPGEVELLLLNAVYFKGLWQLPFDSAATRPAPFLVPSGGSVEVPMMERLADVRYWSDESYAAVRLPYLGDRFASYLLLPHPGVSISDAVDELTTLRVGVMVDSMRLQEVRISVPRILHRNSLDLLRPLRDVGVERALSPEHSDLSGLWENPEGRLRWYVNQANQSTYFRFDEEGTEAVALTSANVVVTGMSPPPVVFKADRPYLILIRDDLTGVVLFVAKVVDPRDTGS